jgi:rubrerythrin
MFTPLDILDVAIQIERNGEKVFREAVKQVRHPELADLLKWIADQEKAHIQWFIKLKQKIKKPFTDPILQEMGREILQETIEGASFNLKNINFYKIDEIKELLNLSIEFEKDSAIFYELLLSFVEDRESQDLLEKIIDEEHNHAKLLKEFSETVQMA